MTPAQRAHRDKLAEEYSKTIDREIIQSSPRMSCKCIYSDGYAAAHAEAKVLVKALEAMLPYYSPQGLDYITSHNIFNDACEALKAWSRND